MDVLVLLMSLTAPVTLLAQGTAFTSQGRLGDSGSPANGRRLRVWNRQPTWERPDPT
ncbi:MAG TPA: hypothetical protein VFZ59_08160 [Verrucomicrobiae bacterium]|nr:hypothetical protein [Verrucomicrobiae bacterium]